MQNSFSMKQRFNQFFAYIGKWERGVSYVHLETLKSLDRETTASYLLNISATASEQAQQVNGVYLGTLNF